MKERKFIWNQQNQVLCISQYEASILKHNQRNYHKRRTLTLICPILVHQQYQKTLFCTYTLKLEYLYALSNTQKVSILLFD